MNIIIHRGSQEIGGNCIEVFSNNTRIILDIGQPLPNLEDENNNLDQIEQLPRVDGLYKNAEKTIDALLISHGHGDHIGLLNYIHPDIPVFIGENAIKIHKMTLTFNGQEEICNPFYFFQSGKEFPIGDFLITPFLVDHSGFDAYAFLIKHRDKSIVYTGDFRFHGRKQKATEYFLYNLPKKVDSLLIEGTLMSRLAEKVESEQDIENKAYDFMNSHNTPIFVLQSSTNIDRLVGMYRAAKRSGRLFIMDIFTANIVSQLNATIPKPGSFNDVRVFYPYHLTKKMFKTREGEALMKQFSRFRISRDELSNREDYCMLIRNSMVSDLQHIQNIDGSGLIYSMWNGYKKQKRMMRLFDYAKSKNMNMIDLHTSGHACIDSLQRVIHRCQPKKIIPIHTEKPNLFADKFQNVHLANDGEIIFI